MYYMLRSCSRPPGDRCPTGLGISPLISKIYNYRCRINKHSSYSSCYQPHPFPPNVNVHGHGTCECNGRINEHSLLLAAAGIFAGTLKLGERGLNFQNTGDIEMSVYLSDTGTNTIILITSKMIILILIILITNN